MTNDYTTIGHYKASLRKDAGHLTFRQSITSFNGPHAFVKIRLLLLQQIALIKSVYYFEARIYPVVVNIGCCFFWDNSSYTCMSIMEMCGCTNIRHLNFIMATLHS